MRSILRRNIIIAFCLFLPVQAGAGSNGRPPVRSSRYVNPSPAKHWRWLERDWGTALVLRPYRSYSSLFIDLDKDGDFTLWEEDEVKLYRELVRRSVRPGYFLIELTGYPLAAFSAYLEAEQNSSYQYFDVSQEFNLIRSLGAGYQEPWSTSIFLGQLATFWDLDEADELVLAATGAAGFVATAGIQQLFDNCVVKAEWFRIEWKVKGEGIEGGRKRFWDLKAGYRWYGIPEISNTISLSLKRQRTDKQSRGTGLSDNSMAAMELQMPASEIGGGFSRVLLEYARFMPFRKILAGLKVGFLYEHRRPYEAETGAFGEDKVKSWELILQPMVIF
ncbi:MAG: hypothetical protein JSU77_02900 [Fidelibacterota bacterium]|nr:MAG: hypothetical protein JSU77_02900 [Candidatus Neomarinimicrobiota bacterium]